MRNILDEGKWALLTLMLFLASLAINAWIFTNVEFVRGINWVYLPAGVRLLCTLMFGAAGAVGLLFASWIACFYYFFPDDFVRSLAGGILATVAPYIAYRWAQATLRLQPDLSNLNSKRLVLCAIFYAFTNAAAHHAWFFFRGERTELLQGLVAMFTGDLMGSLLVLYALKGLLAIQQALTKRQRARVTQA